MILLVFLISYLFFCACYIDENVNRVIEFYPLIEKKCEAKQLNRFVSYCLHVAFNDDNWLSYVSYAYCLSHYVQTIILSRFQLP